MRQKQQKPKMAGNVITFNLQNPQRRSALCNTAFITRLKKIDQIAALMSQKCRQKPQSPASDVRMTTRDETENDSKIETKASQKYSQKKPTVPLQSGDFQVVDGNDRSVNPDTVSSYKSKKNKPRSGFRKKIVKKKKAVVNLVDGSLKAPRIKPTKSCFDVATQDVDETSISGCKLGCKETSV